jgi:hypothetical protein
MKLTDTQMAILTAAAQHPERLAYPPERLPAAAQQAVAKALLKHDLVIAVHRPAYDAIAKWMVDGDEMLLKITDAGLRAIGVEPAPPAEDDEQSEAAILRRNAERRAAAEAAAATEADTAPTGRKDATPGDVPAEDAEDAEAARGAPTAAQLGDPAEDLALLDAALAAPDRTAKTSLRDAAAAVLAAWDDEANREADIIGALDGLMRVLRAALAGKPPRAARGRAAARSDGAPRKPREGTKQEAVLAMLRRPEGATVAQIAEATGWAPHTVRGFFAGLKKRQGIEVQVLERVRQVGPNREGARGSFTIYRIAT